MKRTTIYAILAETETGERVELMTGNRKEIETLYKAIIADSPAARWISTEKGKFKVYAYGSTRTTRPDLIKPVMSVNDQYKLI